MIRLEIFQLILVLLSLICAITEVIAHAIQGHWLTVAFFATYGIVCVFIGKYIYEELDADS